MKKVIITVVCFITLCTGILFIGCTKNSNVQNTPSNPNTSPSPTVTTGTNPNTSPSPTSTTGGNNSTANAIKSFTLSDLKKYNGQNGNPAYVAVNGTVYDVTNAKRWKNGKHENGIVAGVDLTSSMPKSPHGNSVLNGLPVIGTLTK